MKGKHMGDPCWKKPHESCRLGSRPECNVCVDALNQIASKLKELRKVEIPEVVYAGQLVPVYGFYEGVVEAISSNYSKISPMDNTIAQPISPNPIHLCYSTVYQ